jgi:glutamate formiminotransferase
MRQIVECVPNFSEGRRQEVIDQILAAVVQVPGARLLDVKSDPDHNRSVVTVIGTPQATSEAAFQAAASAARLIDMEHHQGGHPRMGATDVIPFVPVQGVTMEDCVTLARQLGQRVGQELGIPVYLYEEAATRPDRHNLADVRRGEYEGLKKEIATNPDRAPDFGPVVMGTAGATAIGARPWLIAFNVYLNTDDVSPAKAIAKAVRHSNGGLRFVKALGLVVEGRAQVSMNLTDYHQTPMHRVLELIRAEAAYYGLTVTHSEVVGLLPAEALSDVAQFYLQLRGFSSNQVLENRLLEEE